MKKFNGVYLDYLRWYDSESGEVVRTKYSGEYKTEIEFSRKKLKTTKLEIKPVQPEVADNDSFYINGVASKGGRITIDTGKKAKLYISKRLVDFLYCSTNQPYRSCYRLGICDTNNLVKMHADPHIYIAYLSQEEMDNNVEYALRHTTYEDKPAKMQGRAFVYTDGKKFLVGRPYGKYGFEVRDALRRFFPNGLEEFYLDKASLEDGLIAFETDNFDAYDERRVKVCHDRLDNCFDKSVLYGGGIKWKN